MVLKMLHISVVDPYHFDADPGSENVHYGSGSRPNFDTDPNPGKNYTDPDPGKKEFSTKKIVKICFKKRPFPMHCVFILLLGLKNKSLFLVGTYPIFCFQRFLLDPEQWK